MFGRHCKFVMTKVCLRDAKMGHKAPCQTAKLLAKQANTRFAG